MIFAIMRPVRPYGPYSFYVSLISLYRTTPFLTLSNAALEKEGVTRRAKWRALRELEALRLIMVERRPRQSPRVVLLA